MSNYSSAKSQLEHRSLVSSGYCWLTTTLIPGEWARSGCCNSLAAATRSNMLLWTFKRSLPAEEYTKCRPNRNRSSTDLISVCGIADEISNCGVMFSSHFYRLLICLGEPCACWVVYKMMSDMKCKTYLSCFYTSPAEMMRCHCLWASLQLEIGCRLEDKPL